MRKALSAILATTVLLTATARAQYLIYTNAPAGSTVSLTNDLEISVPAGDGDEAIGIAFDSGAGDGTLSGSGHFTVNNTAAAVSNGAARLIGIQAATLTNSYSGAVTINQDLSAYTLDLEGAAYGYDADIHGTLEGAVTVSIIGPAYNDAGATNNTENNSTAIGINGNISSNLNASVTATATGGSSIGSDVSAQNARATAYGVKGNIGGDVNAAVTATAQATTAMGGIARTPGEAYGVAGNIDGSVNADITVEAVAGYATSGTNDDSYAYSVAEAYGITGTVSNDVTSATNAVTGTTSRVIENTQINSDVTSAIQVTAQGGYAVAGGTQSAFADATAIGIQGDIVGDLSGQIYVTATGGTAVNTGAGGETADATAIGIDSSGVPVSQVVLDGGSITASAIAGTIGGVSNGASASAIAISADSLSLEIHSGAVSADASGSNASAMGVLADSLSLVMNSGTVSADAAGSNTYATAISANTLSLDMGSATVSANATGFDATATAISANALSMTNSGVISASATGSNATATAIEAGTVDLYMDAGSLTALENGNAAAAISAGSGSVYFGNVDVVGSVGSVDMLSVYGHSSIDGDITAASASIENDGSLTFINEQAMLTGNLTVKSNATLGVLLTPGDTGATALTVSGSVTVEETGKLGVTVPKGTDSESVIGNTYRAVGTSTLNGSFEDAPSLYTFSATNLSDGVWITIDGVAQQVGASTPAVANSLASLSRSTLGLMADISSRMEGVRSVLRDPASIAAPIGAAGPNQAASGDWTAYLHQVNHRGEQEGEQGVDGYDFQSHGFMLGTEKVFNQQTLFGINGGYLNTGFDGDISKQEGSSGLFAANLYGDRVMDAWHWGAGLTLAASSSDTKRRDSGGEYYIGEFDSSYLGGWLDGGYSIFKESVTYEPYARAAYLHSQHDGYTDSGGGAPLSVEDNTVDNLITEIGLKVSKTWHRAKKRDEFEISVKAGWLQEWMDNQVIIDNATLGGVPQVFKSTDSSASALVLGITENWFVSDQWTLGLTYKPVISGNWYCHSFSVNLDYRF